MEFGLCCLFHNEPISFKSYSFAHLTKLASERGEEPAHDKIVSVWEHNCTSLEKAISFCRNMNILGFRITSDLFPQSTRLLKSGLVDQSDINTALARLATIDSSGVILSMHPGQHVNLGTPHSDVRENSLIDLDEHFAVAEAVGANEINIHIGGAYGNKSETIARFRDTFQAIPERQRHLLTIENDELNYSIAEVVETAQELSLRAVYDIHHQRCHELKYPSTGTERDYFELARSTWPDEQIQRLHISSPRNGYSTLMKSRPHADFITPVHIPEWLWEENVLVDIEAKAKEVAIQALRQSHAQL